MKKALFRIVVVAGHERQRKSAQNLPQGACSPDGHGFGITWVAAGYQPSRRVLREIRKSVLHADLVLVAPRLGKIVRSAAIAEARRAGVAWDQLHGAGTGISGVYRQAGDAVDKFVRRRGAA